MAKDEATIPPPPPPPPPPAGESAPKELPKPQIDAEVAAILEEIPSRAEVRAGRENTENTDPVVAPPREDDVPLTWRPLGAETAVPETKISAPAKPPRNEPTKSATKSLEKRAESAENTESDAQGPTQNTQTKAGPKSRQRALKQFGAAATAAASRVVTTTSAVSEKAADKAKSAARKTAISAAAAKKSLENGGTGALLKASGDKLRSAADRAQKIAQSSTMGKHSGWDRDSSPADHAPTSDKFRKFFLLGVLLAFILLGAFGIKTLQEPLQHFKEAGYNQKIGTLPLGDKTAETGASAEGGAEAKPAAQPVKIRQIDQQSVDGKGRDFPEDTGKMLDGDPATAWQSRILRYERLRDYGVGLSFKLDEVTRLTGVTLKSTSTGGLVRLVAANDNDPWHGETVAEGAFAPETKLTFAPREFDRLTLQIVGIPKDPEGNLRAQISELVLQR